MATEQRKLLPPPYGKVRAGLKFEECQFYHTVDLPGVGVVGGFEGGNWDLRPSIEDFLGGIDFKGKRVLEIGPASGFLTFEMERRGASVVCLEIPEDHVYDVVPYPELTDRWLKAVALGWKPMTNSWWFSREKWKSKAEVIYVSAGELDQYDVGAFDISIMANMLLHNRDPLKIMQNAARVTKEKVVVIDILEHALEPSDWPLAKFVPNPIPVPGKENWNQWWRLSTKFVANALMVSGFRKPPVVTKFAPLWNGHGIDSYRVIASK